MSEKATEQVRQPNIIDSVVQATRNYITFARFSIGARMELVGLKKDLNLGKTTVPEVQ